MDYDSQPHSSRAHYISREYTNGHDRMQCAGDPRHVPSYDYTYPPWPYYASSQDHRILPIPVNHGPLLPQDLIEAPESYAWQVCAPQRDLPHSPFKSSEANMGSLDMQYPRYSSVMDDQSRQILSTSPGHTSSSTRCVAMPDVTSMNQLEGAFFHDVYHNLPQDGYSTMPQCDSDSYRSSSRSSVTSPHEEYTDEPEDSPPIQRTLTGSSSDAPNLRRRRPTASRTWPTSTTPMRAPSRRTHWRIRAPEQPAATKPLDALSTESSAFICPFAIYGCRSTFGSKNEWKRHVSTQHMRLSFWRCDQCPSGGERRPNDFNRKDLFTQHVRRMHPFDTGTSPPSSTSSTRSSKHRHRRSLSQAQSTHEDMLLTAAADRCHRPIRAPPPESACLYCDQTFAGPTSWDERMEHVGRHIEQLKKSGKPLPSPAEWRVDSATHSWLLRQRIIRQVGKGPGFVLADEYEGKHAEGRE